MNAYNNTNEINTPVTTTGLGTATGLGVPTTGNSGVVVVEPVSQHRFHPFHHDKHAVESTSGALPAGAIGNPMVANPMPGNPVLATNGEPGVLAVDNSGRPIMGNVQHTPLGSTFSGAGTGTGFAGTSVGTSLGDVVQSKVAAVQQSVAQGHAEVTAKTQEKIAQLKQEADVRHAKLNEKDAPLNKHTAVDTRLATKLNDVDERALKEHHKVDESAMKKVNKIT